MESNEMLVNYYTISGEDYIVLSETSYNGNRYVYLSNEKKQNDYMVRRLDGDILKPLDSEEELIAVLKLLVK